MCSYLSNLLSSLYSSIPILDNAVLNAAYEKKGIIAGHTECCIFSVQKKNAPYPQERALKCNIVEPPLEVLKRINTLASEHLVPTKLIGKIRTKPKPFISDTTACFVVEPGNRVKKERWVYVYEMQKMEGTLKELKEAKKLTCLAQAAIEVQRAAVEAFLYTNGITVADIKDTNVLWERLPDDDAKLNYDFWKYSIGKDTYYIPPMPLWIKLCDFDHWDYSKLNAPRNFSKLFAERVRHVPEIMEKLALFKQKPPKNANVLVVVAQISK